ncbi:MAG: hypothetical protein AAGD06_01480 [Acidobacteriota bacterium]
MFETARGLGTEEDAPQKTLFTAGPDLTAADVHGAADVPGAAASPPEAATTRAMSLPTPATAVAEPREAGVPTLRDIAAGPTQPSWRCLGPFSIPHGQTSGTGPGSRPSVSGRIASVAVDPRDSAHLLIGAAGGGVWESRDGGGTWSPRTDGQPTLAIGAVAFDPADPSIAYAGTGEGNFLWRLGAGLLRSTDGGATWSMWAAEPFLGDGFFDLGIDPENHRVLLAATHRGLWRSTDGGATWRRLRNRKTWSLSYDPQAKEWLAACEDGLWRCFDEPADVDPGDDAAEWQPVPLEDPLGSVPQTWDRLAVHHAPGRGDIAYVAGAAAGGVWAWRRPTRRIDGGGDSGATPPEFLTFALPPRLDASQAWYDWCLSVTPHNPDVLYLGAVELWRGVHGGGGAFAWENLSARDGGHSIHPDQHSLAFDPRDPSVLYVANDGGLYRGDGGGDTWRSLNAGLCITEVEYLCQHPEHPAWLLAGTQDNGTLRYVGEPAWFQVQDGDGGDCGLDETSPYTCYHSFHGMGLERSTVGGRWGSWRGVGPVGAAAAVFYPPMEVGHGVVAQGGDGQLWISEDGGDSFAPVQIPGGSSALAVASSQRIYVGTTEGAILRLDRGAAGFALTNPQPAVPRTGYVSDLLADPGSPGRLWATYSTAGGGTVFRSDDDGASWLDVSRAGDGGAGGLPDLPVNAVAVDPEDSAKVWVAADVGVHQSDDGGGRWTSFGRGLPNAVVADLCFHPGARLLRAATHSRGVWEVDVDPPSDDRGPIPYLRRHGADLRRSSVDRPGVRLKDPFHKGSFLHPWQSPDLKLDTPPFQSAGVDDLGTETFSDDHGVHFSGLVHESPRRGAPARVFVQVHHRGDRPAEQVAVRALWTEAAVVPPDLPADVCRDPVAEDPPETSLWRAVAPAKVLSRIEPGRSVVVGFEWTDRDGAAGDLVTLAAVARDLTLDPASDPVRDPVRDRSSPARGLLSRLAADLGLAVSSVVSVRPPTRVGPRRHLAHLRIRPPADGGAFHLGVDRGFGRLAAGLVFSPGLAARFEDSQVRTVELSAVDRARLEELMRRTPGLHLDINRAVLPKRWTMLRDCQLAATESMAAVFLERPYRGHWSLTQTLADGTQLGGFTFWVP